MKKHILGVATFGLIVISSCFITLNLISKSDFVSTVDDFISIDASEVTCKILSAKYDSAKNEFTQEIKFYWKGNGNPPKSILVNTNIRTSSDVVFVYEPTVNVNFNNTNTATVLVSTKLHHTLDPKQNYYANIRLFDEDSFDSNDIRSLVKSSPILFVH